MHVHFRDRLCVSGVVGDVHDGGLQIFARKQRVSDPANCTRLAHCE